jgi:hypothetical protein
MRRLPLFTAWLMIFLVAAPAPCKTSRKAAPFEIDRPTVIAFFPSEEKIEGKDTDTNDSLSDFQLYAASARQRMSGNVDLEVVYTRSFQVVLDGRVTTFSPPRAEPGYYFAAPGKKPRIEYGVMNDSDILRVAQEYFGTAMK